MSNNPTTQAPVSDVIAKINEDKPFELPDQIRESLIEIFCSAFNAHKIEYLQRKDRLAKHLAKEDRDEKHDAVLISLCDFSERYMRNTALTYKDLTNSNFWLDELNKTIQEANQTI